MAQIVLPNNSVDRSGGDVFRIKPGAAKLALIRAARSTQTYDCSQAMDNEEARSVLTRELETYRRKPYADLLPLLDDKIKLEITGASGTHYQVDVYAVWDDKPNGNLRVFGAIDDSGWRAFLPVTDCFILRPDGTFVGE